MRVSAFQASVARHGGLQRQHRWRVVPNLPASVVDPTTAQDMSLQAVSTQLPPSTLGEIPVQWGGREIPYPGDRKFEPFPITFIGVQDDFAHAAFEAWSEALNGTESNTTEGSQQDLLLDQTLQLLDENDNVIREYTLQGAWPLEVGAVELDQQSGDSFTQFTVTLRYLQHTSNVSR